jgi:predicted GH43/DUF377 family glycosyl hydrolase
VGDEVVMLYRAVGETEAYVSRWGLAKSKDGINFSRVSDQPIFQPKEVFNAWGVEDPRITKIDEDYYVTYVAVPERVMLNGEAFPRKGPLETSIGLVRTKDFTSFASLGVISPKNSDNKDAVIFPRKINGKYWMLHRPNHWHRAWCDHLKATGEVEEWPCNTEILTDNPGIWVAWSDDLIKWEEHKILFHTSHPTDSKIGAGIPPVETPDGWLLIYHHVIFTDDHKSFIYTVRAALLDLEDPTKLIGKLSHDILLPEAPYEKERNIWVVFPTGGFISGDKLFVYYGASDKYVCLATGELSTLIAELKEAGPDGNGIKK